MFLISHIRYLWYLIRHKWYVLRECWSMGLFWLGIAHDWTKFMPCEWFPYVRHFYGPKPIERDAVGYYKPTGVSEEFDRAWLHHIHRNAHHWQYWLLVQDDDEGKILEMPLSCLKGMIADWRGAGRAQGTPNTLAWYIKHKEKIQLHPESRIWVELFLEVPHEHRIVEGICS